MRPAGLELWVRPPEQVGLVVEGLCFPPGELVLRSRRSPLLRVVFGVEPS